MVAFATDQGVPAVVAGNVLALMGLMGVIGVIATGALSDTFGPLLPTACCFLIRIGLFASIPFIRSDTGIIVFALLCEVLIFLQYFSPGIQSISGQ